jgi:hypothetical protein
MMTKKFWIGFAIVVGMLIATCCGGIGWFVVTQGKKALNVVQDLSDYSARRTETSEAENFSADLYGGGRLDVYEIGIRNGDAIKRWRLGKGWDVVTEKDAQNNFEYTDGYIFGKISGRKLDGAILSCYEGSAEIFDDQGNLGIDFELYDEMTELTLSFSEGKFEKAGGWTVSQKATGRLGDFSGFALGAVTEILAEGYLIQEYPPIDYVDIDAKNTNGFFYKASDFDLSRKHMKLEYLKKDGSRVAAKPYYFFSDESEDQWWYWHYEGDLTDIAGVEYFERHSETVEILGLDFPDK